MTHKVDCVIVGAGWSGLSAAHVLLNNSNTTPSVLILEAMDRVGGRTFTDADGTDLGGAYVGPGQRHLLRMIDVLGGEVFKVPTTGKTAQSIRGAVRHYQGTIPPISIKGTLCLNDAIVMTEKLVESIDPEHPERCPEADKLDSMTCREWLEHTVIPGSGQSHKDARAIMEVAIQSILCVSSSEVSALGVAWYICINGGTKRVFETKDGLQDSKVRGGMGAVAVKLYQRLVAAQAKHQQDGIGCKSRRSQSDLVQFQSPVRCIDYTNKEAIQVHYTTTTTTTDDDEGCTSNWKVVEAKYVILALPPIQQLKIEFLPALPAARTQALQRWPMGHIIKTFLYYETPFWRENNLVGAIVSDSGPSIVTMDDTKPDGSMPGIMGFVPAEHAVTWGRRSQEERKAALAAKYAAVFQDPRALHPIGYKEKNWAEEPWVGGCYTGVPQVRALTNYPWRKVLCEPLSSSDGDAKDSVPSVFIAGTEAAKKSVGYIDGAVEAGERAAANVLNCLAGEPPLDALKVPNESLQMKEVALDVTAAERALNVFHRHVVPIVPFFLVFACVVFLWRENMA